MKVKLNQSFRAFPVIQGVHVQSCTRRSAEVFQNRPHVRLQYYFHTQHVYHEGYKPSPYVLRPFPKHH